MELRNFGRLLTSLILLVFVHDASVAQTNNYSSKLFPTPEVLKPKIEFWKNIYAKYSERDVVIHDSEDLSVVYTVINLDSLFHGIYISQRLQWKKIKNIKKEYRAILLKLARRTQLNLESLVGKEKFVASLFGEDLNRKRLRRAARRIRAQTGLKERFKLG
ncbi:hypothetical protein GWO43_05485, partial [candidate division KSB1 bacterium]|nr:hypothetical protein [candidate division KSB1 bacterium]NIR71602.1 hypothetical protein [candidate division KSB1 bacterium]NIS23437.1 hypothetical protein [candidate division KSB1 bacterium]NIT70345.1 hypothetical protein [candidate division KSB1 bacterium]NIU24047.1 hypothetical protein [candidate division KSB1 bacterium]